MKDKDICEKQLVKLPPLILHVFEKDEFKYDIEFDDPREAFCNVFNREFGHLGYEARPA